VQPLAWSIELLTADHDLLTGSTAHDFRLDGGAQRAYPRRPDLIERHAHADAVHLAARRQSRGEDGGIEAGPVAVGRLSEQECLAVLLLDAAAKLPAHQRMHLGVFVDRLVHYDEQPLAREPAHVIVQVGIAARRVAALRREAGEWIDARTVWHGRFLVL